MTTSSTAGWTGVVTGVWGLVFCLGLAPGAGVPEIGGWELKGDRWTCVADGKPLSGVLLKPSGDGPFPAIILSHGLGGSARSIARARGQEMVGWGFVCIAVDYTHAAADGAGSRGRSGRFAGVDFSKAGARPENIRRALACIEILRRFEHVDARRIAAYGHSMGAFVTVALAAEASDRIAAAAITAGGVVTDRYRAGAAPAEDVAARVRVPLLILQGGADTTVSPECARRLKEVLDASRVPNELRMFDGVGHNLPTDRAVEVGRLMRDWFTRFGVLPPA